MKIANVFSNGAAIAVLGLATLALPSVATAQDVAAEIKKVQAASQKYTDIKVAMAEGYILAPPGHCITAAKEGLPAHLGGMGLHYINPKLLKITGTQPRVDGMSTHTDFMRPSILLYEPRADGSMELIGVENLVFQKAWKGAGNKMPPKFAGRGWDPMADNPATPNDEAHNFMPHYDQHVYFRKHAKTMDQLKPFSPTVTCEHHKDAPQGGGQKK